MAEGERKDNKNGDLKESPKDHFEKLAKAVVAGAPLGALAHADPALAAILTLFGPSIVNLVSEYIPSRVQKKRIDFLIGLGKRIEELEDHQKAFVATDQFAMLFHRIANEVGIEANEEKIQYYGNALLSALTLDAEDALEDAYVGMLQRLNPIHLEILRALWVDCRPKWLSYTYPGGDAVVEGKDITAVLPNRAVPLLYEFIHDLAVDKIVVHLGERGEWTLPSVDPETLNCALTNFGIGFLAFITPDYPAPEYLQNRRHSSHLPVERQAANLAHVTVEE